MAEEANAPEPWELKLKGALDICRACAIFVIMIVGCVIASSIKGSTYYTLQEESLLPHCRVIVYPHNKDGMMLDFGKYGGGDVVKFGTVATNSVVMERYKDEEIKVKGSTKLETEECDLHFLKKKDGTYMMLNTKSDSYSGVGIFFPPECGGSEDREWLKNGGDSEVEGLWGDPLIASCVFWFPLRLMGIAMGWSTFIGFNEKAGFMGKACMQFSIYFLFTVCLGIMISPIQNLQTSENCPQIITSYYSGRTSVIIATFGSILLLDLVFIAWSLFNGGKDEIQNASCAIVDIFKVMFLNAKKLWDTAEKDEKNRTVLQILALLSASVGLLPMMSILGGVVYKYYEIKELSFMVILGLKLDLALRFPEFDLAAKLNAFHVLTFILWFMDILNFFSSYILKGISMIKKRFIK